MGRKNLKFLWAFCPLFFSGCLVYPRLYWQKESGQATLKNGQPLTIKGQIIKECDTTDRVSEKIEDEKAVATDSKGFYDFTLRAFLWEFQNFLTGSECSSHIQLYTCSKACPPHSQNASAPNRLTQKSCAPACKPVDAVDINILGE
jgi:hypothetical protein